MQSVRQDALGGAVLPTLRECFETYRPGKPEEFIAPYGFHLAPLRESARAVLEIGVGNGGCLMMWREFFPNAMVYGVDLDPSRAFEDERIKVFTGDQADREFLRSVVDETGEFDFVVDDGGHTMIQQITSFQFLFPHVQPGCVYVIEDLHTSYWPGWGGDYHRGLGSTTMSLLKELVDGLNSEVWKQPDWSNYPPSSLYAVIMPSYEARVASDGRLPFVRTWWDANVASVHFYQSLGFIVRRY